MGGETAEIVCKEQIDWTASVVYVPSFSVGSFLV
uniref:Uncharacterized protein n=1 Tax=Arundo donax TaxID=35708 RepID=A0A0A9GPX3_ARUDO